MTNEVHRKTNTLFLGNSMTIAELELLIIHQEAQALTTKHSGGS